MYNFVYHNPVKVIFGRNVLENIGPELLQLGTSALLVYGRGSIIKNGIYRQVVNSLDDSGISFAEHADVQANPLLFHVRRGVEKARQHNSQVIIGVGGGSVMDTAKAIAAGVPAPHDVWKFFTGKKSVRQALPVLCVPTIAASGSDMNSGMVLTHDEKKLKFGFAHRRLYPKVSLSDPAFTFSVPPDQTAFGAVDTITHCLEAYFTSSAPASPFQDRFMENICKTSIETCTRLLTAPNVYEDRATMLWLASMALSGIATSGLGKIHFPLHLIEHGISALFDVPHGAGLSAVIPGWMRYHQSLIGPRFAKFGEQVFGIVEGTEKEKSTQTIELLIHFLVQANCPSSVRELHISPQHFPAIAHHCTLQAKIWRMKDYTPEKITAILMHCYAP